MSPRAALLAAAAALACASAAPHGMLRVEPAGADAGPGSALERELVAVVAGTAAAEGLTCQPETGVELLRCSPATFGNQGHALTIQLRREGSGYAVSVGQSVQLWTTSTPVCAAQASLENRISLALGPGVVHVDARSDCKR